VEVCVCSGVVLREVGLSAFRVVLPKDLSEYLMEPTMLSVAVNHVSRGLLEYIVCEEICWKKLWSLTLLIFIGRGDFMPLDGGRRVTLGGW